MTPPLVSVLMPCFNAERFVAEALESVLAQTYQPIEIIVVDDGSTDESRRIVQGFANRKVILLSQPNLGAACARNKALGAAKGDFVLFLDADDVMDERHIEALIRLLAVEPNCVAASQWDRFANDPKEASFPMRETYCDAAGVEWFLRDWKSGMAMTQSGMFLIPRPLLQAVGGWDEQLSLNDDFEFFTRVILASDGIRFAEGARLYYRSGIAGSLSGQKSRNAAESACLSLLLGTSHLMAAEDSPRARLACANILQGFIYEFYPRFPDLRKTIRARVAELGGASIDPIGPPRFHSLRRYTGWRAARLAELALNKMRDFGLARTPPVRS